MGKDLQYCGAASLEEAQLKELNEICFFSRRLNAHVCEIFTWSEFINAITHSAVDNDLDTLIVLSAVLSQFSFDQPEYVRILYE